MHRPMFSRPIRNIRNCKAIKSESTLLRMTRGSRCKASTPRWSSSRMMVKIRAVTYLVKPHYTTKFPVEKVWSKGERMALDTAAEYKDPCPRNNIHSGDL